MEVLSSKGFAGVVLSLGSSAMLGLLYPDVPAWSIVGFIVTAGLSFTGAAYLLAAFGEPCLPRAIVILSLIWFPLILAAQYKLPGPSFPFVKPAVILNPGTPQAFWVLFVVNRGRASYTT
jgi:hypothetical protein